MKKFTIILMAVLVAVVSWAQPKAYVSHKQLPQQCAAKAAAMKVAPSQKERTLKAPLTAKAQMPATAQKSLRKVPRKDGEAKPLSLNELRGKYVFKGIAFDIENQGTEAQPNYQLVTASIPRMAEIWEVSILDAATNTLGITGIAGGEETVEATYDPTKGTISIPFGQTVLANATYNGQVLGDVAIGNATSEAETLVGTIVDGEVFFTADLWYTYIVSDDEQTNGSTWSGYYMGAMAKANADMAFTHRDTKEDVLVAIDMVSGNDTITVWNFADMGVAIDVILKENAFAIKPQLVVEYGGNYGNFYTSAYGAEKASDIEGVGDETTLTFGASWTLLSDKGYNFYEYANTTIKLTDGSTFTYPVLDEVAATPATPAVVTFMHYDDEAGYAAVVVNIPSKDVDGNDIKNSLLSYQLFTRNEAGEAVAIGEPIDYVTDAKTVSGAGAEKTVQLTQDYAVIAVQSIYTAAGETRRSKLSEWFEVPMPVALPEGIVTKEYPMTATASNNSATADYSGTVNIGIDGEDIYIQGLLPYHIPEGWVKGTIKDGTATFPVQFVGSVSGNFVYLAGYSSNGIKPVTFTYNADDDIYTSQDFILANSNGESLSFYVPYLYSVVLGTESVPEPVEVPADAEVKAYPFTGTTFDDGSIAFETTVNVAVMDNDIYVQGINSYCPEAWVKGTKDEATGAYVFPTGQNFGVYSDGSTNYQQFMVGLDAETGYITDVVMTYDDEEDYYELQNELIVSNKKLSVVYWEWYEAGCTIGTKKTDSSLFDFNTMDVATSTGVTNDGDILRDTIIVRGNVALTIAPAAEGAKSQNRFYSTKNGPQLRMASSTLTFRSLDGAPITTIDFTDNGRWDEGNSASTGTFEGTLWTGSAKQVVVTIAGNSYMNSINVKSAVKQLPPMEPTEAPEDLETAEWSIKATEMVYTPAHTDPATGSTVKESLDIAEYTAPAQVGFYTVEGQYGTEVYIQGLCPELPQAWVKGTLADGKVVIPYSTFFGIYKYFDPSTLSMVEDNLFLTAVEVSGSSLALADVVFDYDAENGSLTNEQFIFVNNDRRNLSDGYYHWYRGMTLTVKQEVAATPADPAVLSFAPTAKYPSVKLSIPTTDVNGNDLVTSKLFYTIWIEKDGKEQRLTFTPDDYDNLTEDMTEIPYAYDDGYDIFAGGSTIYLNQGADELDSWSNIGVQSIYRGGGEENKSAIVWFSAPVGISDMTIAADKAGVVIYDLQGRSVINAKKGLYIVNGKKVIK